MDETPLHKAVKKGNVEAVKTLLRDSEVDVNATDPYFGNTALLLSVILQKDEEILKLLCESRCDVNIKNSQGMTALQYVLNVNKLSVARIFFDAGGCIDSTNLYGKTALHLASRDNDVKMMEYLVRRGANVNHVDVYGRTPLHLLCVENDGVSHLDAFKLLFNNKADLHAKDEDGKTPLDYLNHDVKAMFLNENNSQGVQTDAVKDEDPRDLFLMDTAENEEMDEVDGTRDQEVQTDVGEDEVEEDQFVWEEFGTKSQEVQTDAVEDKVKEVHFGEEFKRAAKEKRNLMREIQRLDFVLNRKLETYSSSTLIIFAFAAVLIVNQVQYFFLLHNAIFSKK